MKQSMHEIELRNSRNTSERTNPYSLEQFLNSSAMKEKQKAVLYIQPVRYDYQEGDMS